MNEYEVTQDAAFQEDLTKKVSEAKKLLESEWGDAYKPNIQKATNVIKEFGGDEMLEYVKATGYGSDPKFMQFLVKIAGSTMGEDDIDPSGGNNGAMTMEQVDEKINAAFSDKAYTDPHHPDHKRKVDEVQKLFQLQAKYQAKN
jgi:hypothetical protein